MQKCSAFTLLEVLVTAIVVGIALLALGTLAKTNRAQLNDPSIYGSLPAMTVATVRNSLRIHPAGVRRGLYSFEGLFALMRTTQAPPDCNRECNSTDTAAFLLASVRTLAENSACADLGDAYFASDNHIRDYDYRTGHRINPRLGNQPDIPMCLVQLSVACLDQNGMPHYETGSAACTAPTAVAITAEFATFATHNDNGFTGFRRMMPVFTQTILY